MQAITSLPFYLYLEQIHKRSKSLVLPSLYDNIFGASQKENAIYIVAAKDHVNQKIVMYNLVSGKWGMVDNTQIIFDNIKPTYKLYIASTFAIGNSSENVFTIQLRRDLNEVIMSEYAMAAQRAPRKKAA